MAPRAGKYHFEMLGLKVQWFIRDGETTIKIEFAFLKGGGAWGQRGKSSQNAVFHGKRHDNKILNVQFFVLREILLAPIESMVVSGSPILRLWLLRETE